MKISQIDHQNLNNFDPYINMKLTDNRKFEGKVWLIVKAFLIDLIIFYIRRYLL